VTTLHVQVAQADFAGREVSFYMSSDSVNKSTSMCPCPAWLCKGGFDEEKALFAFRNRTEMVEFDNAHFVCS
jgi:hypothetical protein